MRDHSGRRSWLSAYRVYLGTSLAFHFLWEIAQLPLYSIWKTGSLREILFAVVHCSLGDLVIAALTLLASVILLGTDGWPQQGARRVVVATLLLGLAYTFYSEWLNVFIRASWAYSDLMPRLPFTGTGVAPLLQWLVVPSLALYLALHRPIGFVTGDGGACSG